MCLQFFLFIYKFHTHLVGFEPMTSPTIPLVRDKEVGSS